MGGQFDDCAETVRKGQVRERLVGYLASPGTHKSIISYTVLYRPAYLLIAANSQEINNKPPDSDIKGALSIVIM